MVAIDLLVSVAIVTVSRFAAECSRPNSSRLNSLETFGINLDAKLSWSLYYGFLQG